jgi:hypothetical protein
VVLAAGFAESRLFDGGFGEIDCGDVETGIDVGFGEGCDAAARIEQGDGFGVCESLYGAEDEVLLLGVLGYVVVVCEARVCDGFEASSVGCVPLFPVIVGGERVGIGWSVLCLGLCLWGHWSES